MLGLTLLRIWSWSHVLRNKVVYLFTEVQYDLSMGVEETYRPVADPCAGHATKKPWKVCCQGMLCPDMLRQPCINTRLKQSWPELKGAHRFSNAATCFCHACYQHAPTSPAQGLDQELRQLATNKAEAGMRTNTFTKKKQWCEQIHIVQHEINTPVNTQKVRNINLLYT